MKKEITLGTYCSSLTQLALLVRGCRSNDIVVLKGFLAVVLLLYNYSLFLRIKSFIVQSDLNFFFRLACRNITSNRIQEKKRQQWSLQK